MTTLKGTHITLMDATPPGVVDGRIHGGRVKSFRDAFEIGNTSNGDITILFRVQIDAVVKSLKISHDALTSGALDFGVYRKKADGTYVAVNDDCFAAAYNPTSAAADVELLFQAAATNIVDGIKALWDFAGVSTRPDYNDLYIAITHDTGTGADGTVMLDLDVYA